MLDDNLRVLTRRMNDLEIELADKKDKLLTMERAQAQTKTELDGVYDKQSERMADLEREHMEKIQVKDSEMRKIREELQEVEHRH